MKQNNQVGSQGWTPERIVELRGKLFVITGANAGAGYQAARILLSKGASVLMLNRSVARSEQAVHDLKLEFGEDARVSFVRTDLGDLESVRDAARRVLQMASRIDALICNAAIAQVAHQEFTKDGFESQLGVNHCGHFLLSSLLFERIEESQGRIVVVASEGHKMGLRAIQFDDMNWDNNYHPNKTYCHSKLAQMMFAYELQNRAGAANKSVKVYVCHPGASSTSLINEKVNLPTRVTWWLMVKLGLVQSAKLGAHPEVMCATESNLTQRAYYGPTGRWNWTGPVGECELAPFVLDEASLKMLWLWSERATGATWPV
ncbi:oxidoreductase [Arenicella chitinivorans]|uniref:Oxidoreductase n=1 Tax=Arenicella chitinivorans TaxID=1329800 RepID=A0A918RTI9_9GAMM|nr:SDR family NAD(P)-dependent oxidoreductase [Arenicella chitinivorans]GHA12246.1 oxidoreductase [Arenicella chitinivorans]